MRFDQVWYDNKKGKIYGLVDKCFENDFELEVYWYRIAWGKDGMREICGYECLEELDLPTTEEEFSDLILHVDPDCYSKIEEFADIEDEKKMYLDLKEMYLCIPAVTNVVTDVTEAFRNFKFETEREESEMDIFTKIQNLNSEIVEYINTVEDEIKRLDKEKSDILEGRHKHVYQFLLERCKLVEEMFPGKRIDVTMADDGLWFKIGSCGIRLFGEPERRYINLKPSHFCTTENFTVKEKEFYNDFITNWDSIMEEVFDKHLYEALSEMMTEQVRQAKEHLENVRKELNKVK